MKEQITIVFTHTGCFKGKAQVFHNDCNITRMIAETLGYRVNKHGAIVCNWVYVYNYGDDIMERMRGIGYDYDFKCFEVNF